MSQEDEIVWSLDRGATIIAVRELIMEFDGRRAFTTGRRYQVAAVYPIADPAAISVADDQGNPHRLSGADLREYFGLRPNAVDDVG
ncbi:MAG: hypothetical protein U1F54_16740 [Burkholderiales bacterium]